MKHLTDLRSLIFVALDPISCEDIPLLWLQQRQFGTRIGRLGWRPLRASAGAQVTASPLLVSMVPWFMARTGLVAKKKRGPPPTGRGVQVGERWHPSELAAIDAWIASSSDKTLTRAHAIRRLVALGLKAKAK